MMSCRIPVIYCVSLVSCFFAFIAIDLACGGEVDPYDYYISFFHNNLQGGKEYRSFYFTNYQFLYDDAEPVSEPAINSNEWASYFGVNVKPEDVAKAMYHLDHRTDSVLNNGFLKNGGPLPDSMANNTFLKAFLIKKNISALKYYRFVKNAEHIANVNQDSWNPAPIDSVALRNAGTEALNNAIAEKDRFIQLRYYYQAQRLFHYGLNYTKANDIYNTYIADIPTQSHIKGWAMALKAGEERRLNDTVLSAYLFSKVFAQYPERQVQAYRNYRYMNVKLPQVLTHAVNDKERAIIYAINGFGNPKLNMEYLKKVYQCDPSSPMVGVLLVREINKLEEGYLTHKLIKANALFVNPYDFSITDSTQYNTITYMPQLKAFCKQLTIEKKYTEPGIGYLAAAYISWMQGDTAEGLNWLKQMGEERNPKLNDQKQIIQLLLSAQSIKQLNHVNETSLLPALKWLDDKVKTEIKKKRGDFAFNDDQKFIITARNFYQQILAPSYLQQGDTTKAALVLAKCSEHMVFWQNYLHSANLNAIIKWKQNPPDEPYLRFLADGLLDIKLTDLNELLGTLYLREHKYTNAMVCFKNINAGIMPKAASNDYLADPFIDQINDYPKVLKYGNKSKGYNKLQFAQVMSNLETQIKTDSQNAASYYYKFATGIYNTSHYGNAWYLISYSWSSTDFGRAKKYNYDDDYIKTKNAEKYYLIARSLSNNLEFKAKCTLMAAKCHQKQVVYPEYDATNFDDLQKLYLLQIKNNTYFTTLKTTYKKTVFYKRAVGECSYLKDFILIN